MVIYKTTNLINGKIYVGKDCNNNPKYLGSGNILKNAIDKYGRKNFKKEILELCDANNWCDREKYWIEKLSSRDHKIGYNISEGGEGVCGCVFTEDHRKKISQALSGRTLPVEVKKKISIINTGHKVSLETRQKLSKANSGSNSPNYGKPMPEDRKKKISISSSGKNNHNYGKIGKNCFHFGRKRSELTKQKIKESWVLRKLKMEQAKCSP